VATRIFASLGGAWRGLGLLRQFLIIASSIFLIGMGVVGAQLSQRIERGVVQNTAISTALYFESFVEPLIQELATRDTLSAATRARFDNLINNTALTERVVAFKIWVKGGRVVYASDSSLIGKVYPPTVKMRQAWQGQVSASVDAPGEHAEGHGDDKEGPHDIPLLEVYVPVRQEHSDKILAIAEFYENAEQLTQDVLQAQMESWAMIGGLAVVTIAALYGIISRGSDTISQQRSALQQRIQQLSVLLAQNDELRNEVLSSSRKAADINERYLRRFGAELHDGPAQLLGLALLRLDAVSGTEGIDCRSGEMDLIRKVLKEALDEIRNLSAGLSLPELESLSLAAAINTAVRTHRQRTGTAVDLHIGELPEQVAHAIKGAIYRIVQEGLNNATRHGQAKDQCVTASAEAGNVVVEVSDKGPGFALEAWRDGRHLGLIGLRERVIALRGRLEVETRPASGTRLIARIPFVSEEEAHSV